MSNNDTFSSLPEDEQVETQFDRLRIILGDEGLEKLKNSTVMVLGTGGVGSNAVVALARGGVGHLVLVDRDVVAPSNINRQAVARHSTIGRVKIEVMTEMIHDINPDCKVTTLHEFIERDRVAEQLDALPHSDWVIDAIDTISQKLAIAQWAQDNDIRLISSMGGANKIDPTRFHICDISETQADPFARTIRKECRKRRIKKLEVLYSDETPMKRPIPDSMGRKADGRPEDRGAILGTMSYIPAIMGYSLAGRVISGLLEIENTMDAHRSW